MSPSNPQSTAPHECVARRWLIGGRVQGVGYRPFIYRLAARFEIEGWVRNEYGAVEIFAQGPQSRLASFGETLMREAPPLAQPRLISTTETGVQPMHGFTIRSSRDHDATDVHVPPDQPPCADCLAELRDPCNRRYRYPFINCTACGPRYTVITRLPYDRPHTTLRGFPLCAACAREYADPGDRRFHAQPIGCHECGPRLEFSDRDGIRTHGNAEALEALVAALRAGKIIGVKGVGGYHLLCDAHDSEAIARLRRDKPRPDKPLAVMFPEDAGLATLRRHVQLDAAHESVLRSSVRPILLLPKITAGEPLPAGIAPGLAEIGAMLPYSPLHHLIIGDFGAPLIATSANVSGEPVLTEAAEAKRRLGQVADSWLHHDRPIERRADDAVFRLIAGEARPLRTGRGQSPLELELPFTLKRPLLAVGGHIKNTVALAWDRRIVVSAHIGELEAPRGRAAFARAVQDLQSLYNMQAEAVVCDHHPRYASRRWAEASGLPCIGIFHHHAHAAALAGEHPDITRWLTFTWDGVGYGEDQSLWGGEALLGSPGAWRRAARLRPFRLPGGERAAREPWRCALALCWESGHTWEGGPPDTRLLRHAWQQGLNSPLTSSAGRLFDAAAALTGLLFSGGYEGHGPALLEAVAEATADHIDLPVSRREDLMQEVDWSPLLPMLLDASLSRARRAGLFHSSLAHSLLAQARLQREQSGEFVVGLTGGVFQNSRLTEQARELLTAHGFDVRLASRIPCNDGGLSYGQIIEAGYRGELAPHSV
ncbi:MAG: carbamoyltransferase HypF [Gammaproteobacteria bacterium]|nr:carbamoyltransferase HypF [Gammaproteobacteria bacterium]